MVVTHPGISTGSSFRPVHSRVRQSARQGEHSNHGRLIDPWPIGSTPHLWGAFAGIGCQYGCSRPLSRGFIQEPLQLMHARQGQAFQGVTPSFHLSNYQLSTQHTLRVRQLLTAGERVALLQKTSACCLITIRRNAMSVMSRPRPKWPDASGQKAEPRIILTLCHTSALAGNMVSVLMRH